MIFRGDYGYFSSGDVLCKILPETFARNLALLYLGIVAAEIFCVCDDSCVCPSGGAATPVLDLEKDIFKEGYKI